MTATRTTPKINYQKLASSPTEDLTSLMLGPPVDPGTSDRELDPTHLPARDESQQVPVALGVEHLAMLAEDLGRDLANTRSIGAPTQNPEEPKMVGRVWGNANPELLLPGPLIDLVTGRGP